jgi:ankyrin repeat protein
MRGHVEIVNFLLKHGADRSIRNKQDKLPIDLCLPCWSNAYRFTREVLAA